MEFLMPKMEEMISTQRHSTGQIAINAKKGTLNRNIFEGVSSKHNSHRKCSNKYYFCYF
jgi:hypothetical protein